MRAGIIALGLATLGCTAVVGDILGNKEPLDNDAGPTGAPCGTTADCLMIGDSIFDCTQRCVGAQPGRPGVCMSNHPDGTPDGVVCGNSGGARICVSRTCVMRGCGDGYVDRDATPPEWCDDGDRIDTNGCNNACTRPCGVGGAPFVCNEVVLPCYGTGTCQDQMCQPGAPDPDGTECTDQAGNTGTCQSGHCITD